MTHSMKFLGSTVCLMATLTGTLAYAATDPSDNWYAGANGDLTWLRHSKTGGGGDVDLGYRFWPSNFGDFRVEGEAGYHGAGGSNG